MISVIIPTYNRLKLLLLTLQSLKSEHHPSVDIEIIVVDDHSDDDTWDHVLVNYPYVKLLENKGKGASAARNTGLGAAKGKYILYLDSDDLLSPHFFEKKLNFLEKNGNYNACYGDYDYFESAAGFDNSQVQFKNKYPAVGDKDNIPEHLALYLSGKFIPANAILWRKDFLLKINGHDESLIINQDVDIFFRALFAGMKITLVDDGKRALVRNHVSDTRVGDPRNASRKWEQMLEIREKVFEQMKTKGYTDAMFTKPLAYYIFSRWKVLRHTHPEIAARYLAFTKKVYWPVDLRGNLLMKFAGKVLGPVKVIELKYKLLKRD